MNRKACGRVPCHSLTDPCTLGFKCPLLGEELVVHFGLLERNHFALKSYVGRLNDVMDSLPSQINLWIGRLRIGANTRGNS